MLHGLAVLPIRLSATSSYRWLLSDSHRQVLHLPHSPTELGPLKARYVSEADSYPAPLLFAVKRRAAGASLSFFGGRRKWTEGGVRWVESLSHRAIKSYLAEVSNASKCSVTVNVSEMCASSCQAPSGGPIKPTVSRSAFINDFHCSAWTRPVGGDLS